ncbi:hypothetical protein [Litorivicinus lipolyticus]|uniref:hypothetical protein n=1 Tax=Litorivicinus lipolyticus TaxID=418701 RepID=UPI003B58D6C6
MKTLISGLVASAVILTASAATNVDFPGDGTSADVLSSCLVDLSSAVNGSLGAQAPYTELSSTVANGSSGQARIDATNLPLGTQVTFSAPSWISTNAGYSSGSEQTSVRITPIGNATCDHSDWSTEIVTCTLPSSLGIISSERFHVDSKAIDNGGFPSTGDDYTLRTVVTCAG